ncbi:rhomboid-related protein 3 [Cyanistes caeruleus]|uniref:rhomboid-related protein 3 n=1 Tax=Cyanistes caeruleus TaxID=156563 RepID=UPI000CDAF7B2|nr:rhomboid-related protein 3 [Cyanistes caeruleus]
MSNKRSNSFRQAILQGNRRLCSKALLEETGLSLSQRLIRHVAYETLPREIDRKWYYDSYTCCPPPWFMITITIVEVAFFLYNGVVLDRFVLQVSHPLYLKNALLYHPQLRAQAWRYLTYIFMHAGIEHLGLNVVLQLLVGVPLEMVHGAARISFVYVAGVVAGSLAVSVADMRAPVVGSSGGVYALVSAHLANIVMNWSGMKCQFKLLRMAVALICMSSLQQRSMRMRRSSAAGGAAGAGCGAARDTCRPRAAAPATGGTRGCDSPGEENQADRSPRGLQTAPFIPRCLETDKGESELQLRFSTRSNEDAELAWDLYGNSGVIPPFGSCPFIAVTSELQGS